MGAQDGNYGYQVMDIEPARLGNRIPVGNMDFRIVGLKDDVVEWFENHKYLEISVWNNWPELTISEANEELYRWITEVLESGSSIPGLEERVEAIAIAFFEANPSYLERALRMHLEAVEALLDENELLAQTTSTADAQSDEDSSGTGQESDRPQSRRRHRHRHRRSGSGRRRGKKKGNSARNRQERQSKARRQVKHSVSASSSNASSSSSVATVSGSGSASSSDGINLDRVRRGAMPKGAEVVVTWGQLAEANGGRVYQKEIAKRIWGVVTGYLAAESLPTSFLEDRNPVSSALIRIFDSFGMAHTAIDKKASRAQTLYHVTFSIRGRPVDELMNVIFVSDGSALSTVDAKIGFAQARMSNWEKMKSAFGKLRGGR